MKLYNEYLKRFKNHELTKAEERDYRQCMKEYFGNSTFTNKDWRKFDELYLESIEETCEFIMKNYTKKIGRS